MSANKKNSPLHRRRPAKEAAKKYGLPQFTTSPPIFQPSQIILFDCPFCSKRARKLLRKRGLTVRKTGIAHNIAVDDLTQALQILNEVGFSCEIGGWS